ncbi:MULTISPECIES: beta-galactosidase [unclassified Curtobacterium]|uniref:beta-galactosidase n=1 Tax=unclassified Curtobacterium TaxID=257496 RepID=UPI003A80E552
MIPVFGSDRPLGMPQLPLIGYGGDYNPEQWNPEVIDRDIELMRQAGVNLVTVGVFSWAKLEPTSGVFTLDWLEDVLDRLHAAGIFVDLATGTASPPPWLGRTEPSTLPVTADGLRLSWGSRQQYNPNSSIFREHMQALVERMAARFAAHPAVIAWHVNNEYGCHVAESFDDESARCFRVWLQDRYGSLEAVNEAWGTAFWSQQLSEWDDVIPPRATPTLHNPHHLDDWRRFSSDSLLSLYLLERQILKAANPTIPVTTNFMGLFRPIDYWSWAPHLDFISNDSYPDPANPRAAREFAFECDLMRSLGQGRPFAQMEQVTSAVQWRTRNAVKRPGQYALWSLMAVGLGADAVLNFQWRQSIAGAETFHGGMVPHAETETRTWREVVHLGADLHAADGARGGKISTPIAILWDWENAWAYDHAVGPTTEDAPENDTRDWHATLFELGHSVDFRHPGDDLTGYRVVIVPALFRLTEEAAARIREAVAAGTTVLVTRLTGYVDAHGHAVQDGYLSSIADVLGVRVIDIMPAGVTPSSWGRDETLRTDTDRISATVQTPATATTVPLESRDDRFHLAGRSWAEEITVDADDVDVVATFTIPDLPVTPAVTVREQIGSGAAWYIGTDLDAQSRAGLMKTVLAAEGIPTTITAPGLQILRRGTVTLLLNHSDGPIVHDNYTIAPRSALINNASAAAADTRSAAEHFVTPV